MNNWNSTFSNLFLEENISHLVHLKCIWKQMPINQKYYYLRKKIEELASRFFCLEIIFHIVTLHVLLGNHFNEKTL